MKILFKVSYIEDELMFDVKNKRSTMNYHFQYLTCKENDAALNKYLKEKLNVDANQYAMKVLEYFKKDDTTHRTPIKVFNVVHGLGLVTKYFALDSDIDLLKFDQKLGDTVFGFLGN